MQPGIQDHSQPTHTKDPNAAELGKRGGKKRMEQLNAAERKALARHAARSRWHPQEAQVMREKAEEIAQLVRQALNSK